MKRVVNAILILLLLCPALLLAGDYEKAWEAIHKNDTKTAITYLQKVIKSGGAQKNSAISTLIFIQTATDYAEDFPRAYFNPVTGFTNPAPYVYALWFNGSVLGDYSDKQGTQLENLDRIIADSVNFNGSMRAAARYFKAYHFMASNQNEVAKTLYPQMGALEEWDIVATADIFTPEARQHPFLYGNYENTDDYSTEIHIRLPAGKQFDQVPGSASLQLADMSYMLAFKKESEEKLVINRHFKTNCNKVVAPADFKQLETFFNGIIKAEQKYVSFK